MRLNAFAGVCSLSIVLVSLMSTTAMADAPAVTFTGGSFTNNFPSNTLGYAFNVTSNVTVTGLTFWDDPISVGLLESHAVGLWDSSGNLLAQATVAAGTVAPLDAAGFRVASIAPIVLTPGTNYVVGGVTSTGNQFNQADFALFFANLSGTAPGITFVQNRFISNTPSFNTLTMPTLSDPGFGARVGWFGASLQIGPTVTAAPEPGSCVLLLFGVIPLLRRRTIG